MNKLPTYLASVKARAESERWSPYNGEDWDALRQDLKILLAVIEKLIEQRDGWAKWYIETRLNLNDQQEKRKDDAELTALIEAGGGE